MSAVDVRPPDEPKKAGLPIGDLNALHAYVGQRGQGKSTLMCSQAYDLLQDVGGGYVIGHSMGARLPVRLPDGGPVLPIVYHENLEQLDRGLRRDPGKWHILASSTIPADPVIQYGRQLSYGIRERAWRSQHMLKPFNETRKLDDGTFIAPPVIMLVDEGIMVDAANSKGDGAGDDHRWFKSWLFSLRHEHTALFYSIQNANARSYLLIDQATEINVFHTRHEWALSAIRAGAGASQEQLEAIRALPKYEHIRFK